jgi:hypothetical protein
MLKTNVTQEQLIDLFGKEMRFSRGFLIYNKDQSRINDFFKEGLLEGMVSPCFQQSTYYIGY